MQLMRNTGRTRRAAKGRAEGTSTGETVWRCPHCAEVVRELTAAFRCESCQKQFPLVGNIPVFADAPGHTTTSLSEAEASRLLEQTDAHGWAEGLRRELLRLPGPRGQAMLAEFVDQRGVVAALLVGGPQHASVLCLGCTAGAVPFALAPRFPRVVVCDLSLGRLKLLEKRAGQEQYHNLEFVCSGDAAYLPFPAAEFDLILMDAMAFPDLQLPTSPLWREVARILKASGCCFITAQNRRGWVRSLGGAQNNARSRSLSPGFLRKMLNRSGLRCFGVFGLLPNQQAPQVVFDLATKPFSRHAARRPTRRQRLKSLCLHNRVLVPAFGLAARKQSRGAQTESSGLRGTFVQGIVSSVQDALAGTALRDSTLVARRIEIRRSGRVVILANAQGKQHRPLAIKVPCQPSAEQRDNHNAEALQRIHSSNAVPEAIKRLVPRHLTRGRFGGQPYFVEDAIDETWGSPRGGGYRAGKLISIRFRRRPRPSIAAQFGEVLLALHQATARLVTLTDGEFAPVRRSLTALRRLTEEAQQQRTWDIIERRLERDLLGQQLPLVWSHGDAAIGNLVENCHGELSGIIDWETFDSSGFPLYDWVLLRISQKMEEDYQVGWRWLRWALTGQERTFFGSLPIDAYLKALKLDRELIPALALSAWVQYAAHRLPNRGYDPHWVCRTIYDVLQLCGEIRAW